MKLHLSLTLVVEDGVPDITEDGPCPSVVRLAKAGDFVDRCETVTGEAILSLGRAAAVIEAAQRLLAQCLEREIAP